MKQKKLKFHSRIIDIHLCDACEFEFKKCNQMVINLWSKDRPKFHIDEAELGGFFFFGLMPSFCFGYGMDI
jgi:hypothetical protein